MYKTKGVRWHNHHVTIDLDRQNRNRRGELTTPQYVQHSTLILWLLHISID
jgi:hypothetical protein